jgi:coenzyme PQQ precursor peptide PqqA
MEQESTVSPPRELEWETPAFEEVRVSAEATAYMGAREDWT